MTSSSEEDNDPLTDDAASTISMPVSRNQHIPTSPLAQARSAANSTSSNYGGLGVAGARSVAARVRQMHLAEVTSDDGVDSPTYDGDVETNTATDRAQHQTHLGSSRLSGSSTSTLTSPTSSVFPVSATANAPAVTVTAASRSSTVLPEPAQSVNVAAVPLRVTEEPAPAPVTMEEFDPAKLTQEDIQEFVRKAIAGDTERAYKINAPPVGRPVRIYADGEQINFIICLYTDLSQVSTTFSTSGLLTIVVRNSLF